MKKIGTHEGPHRLLVVLLCLCMVFTTIGGLGISMANAEVSSGGATSGATRQADPSTMDTYKQMLDFSENTRYAGRLWSDKTVFALGDTTDGQDDDWNGSALELTEADDGVKERIDLDEDFLHVYSVLGSSLEINEGYSAPIDLAIIIDMSGSMGQLIDGDNRLTDSRIGKTVTAVNEAVDYLMTQNEDNRVTVVAYGGSAYTLLPLGHYRSANTDKNNGNKYIDIKDVTDYDDDPLTPSASSAAYTLFTTVTRTDGGSERRIIRSVRNNYTKNAGLGDNPQLGEVNAWIGYQTDMTAGIYLGFQELYETTEVAVTYTSKLTGERKTLPRIPVAFVMTDGGTNVALKNPDTPARQVTGSEWYDMSWIPSSPQCENYYEGNYLGGNDRNPNYTQNPDWLLFQNETNNNADRANQQHYENSDLASDGVDGGPGVLFHTLMSASFMTAKVQKHYTDLWAKAGVENAEALDFVVDTIGVDLHSMTKKWEQPRMYASLDPETYFSENPPAAPNSNAENEWFIPQIQAAYEYLQEWKEGSSALKVQVGEQTNGGSECDVITFNKLTGTEENGGGVTNEDVLKNINYADEFQNIESGDLTRVFRDLINSIETPMFTPLAGENDLGVGNAVTYMDPLGKYMEVKDVKGLSLFGEYHGITRTAVYDYQWNDAYIVANPKLDQGTSPLPEGWYRGDAREGGFDSVEYIDPEVAALPPDCGSAEEAWAAGWVYRVNYKTAAQFVPTLGSINSPDMAERKERQTVYTFYRLTDSSAERTALHMNPAYGEDVPENVRYDSEKQAHLNTPGVYALADLRIWVEDSGDYNDSLSGTESDTNYDEALWVNVPVNMLPLRKITINADVDENFTYETNVPAEGANIAANSFQSAAFPLRVFYSVGVSDEVLENSNRINMAAAISPEYILENKTATSEAAGARNIPQGNVEFFSNLYTPLKRYSDYATVNVDYTYGNPVTSFSPSTGNRYYVFQRALPLYDTAYRYDGTRWEKVSVNDGTAANFGGNLLEVLEFTPAAGDGTATNEEITNALEGKAAAQGDIVLLKEDLLTNVDKPDGEKPDPFSSGSYYFLAIDFYELAEGSDTATYNQYVIARKGSEFGSAYSAAGISNGDMLCWHDVSGTTAQDYPYLSFTETRDKSRGRDYIGTAIDPDTGWYQDVDKGKAPSAKPDPSSQPEGEWVVCAKPGGLRVGGLAQAVQEKTGEYISDSDITKYYGEQRYREETDKSSLTWGFYENNVTRTANNYYMPTISAASTSDDIRVNTYLGNNGRLYVADTTLLVTKTVESADGTTPIDSGEEFNFQVFIDDEGFENSTQNAIVVQWNAATGSWQRQFHYVDLELDSQLFLQTADGQKAMVAGDGRRLIPAPGGEGYVYFDDGTSYDAVADRGPFYVYVGRNRSSGDEIGASEVGFRVYHNNVDDNGSVDTGDVIIEGESGKSGTFKAAKVWLVSKERYDSEWMTMDGPQLDPADAGFKIDEHDDGTLSEFELLTINPNVSDTSEITIDTPYRTVSAYWTKTVNFGVNANSDGGPGGVGDELTEDDLYDKIIPSTDRADYFAGMENEDIAARTAEVTLKHGQALLFSGIPSGTVYRVTEKLTEAQMDAGYNLKEVSHTQQVGSTSTYRPGSQLIPVYYKAGTTYLEYGGGAYPRQYNDDETEKGLTWALSKTGTENDAQYRHYEPFHHTNAVVWEAYSTMSATARGDNHHQPISVEDGSSAFWLWNEVTQTSTNTGQTHVVGDNPSCVSLEQGGCDEDVGSGQVRHYFFKDGVLLDKHYQGEGSGYIRNIGRYITSPTVHFGVYGEDQAYAGKDMPEMTPNTNYNGVYSVFGNTGTYEESANFINTINHDKTETQINGEAVKPSETDPDTYPGVQAGDTVTYQIRWANATADKARVVVIDPLDDGVDFLGATAPAGAKYQYFDAERMDAANKYLKDIYGSQNPPVVDKGHVVIWDLGEQNAGSTDTVTLTVKVNEQAPEWWDYDGDGVADEPVDGPAPDDYMVRNRATVRVADNAYNTNTVVNPVGKPDKTETGIDRADGSTDVEVRETGENPNLTPGGDGKYHGPLVYVGDKITYEITWRNYESVPATVTIRDPLDGNVKLISAEFNTDDTAVPDVEDFKFSAPDYTGAATSKLEAAETAGDVKPEGKSTGQTVNTGTTDEPNNVPVIRYTNNDGDCQVVWNLGLQPAGASGKVTLVAEVLSTATPVGYVDNTAFVKINGDSEQQTKTVENPTPEVKKEETAPGNGERVKVGENVSYEISWDSHDTAHGEDEELAAITVTDPLDPGVDFVSASYGGVTLNAGTGDAIAHSGEWVKDEDGDAPPAGQTGKGHWSVTIAYDKETHTVTWSLYGEKAAAAGHVDLTVRVTERALIKDAGFIEDNGGLPGKNEEDWDYRDDGGIETESGQLVQNRSAVRFGNDADLVTELVKNPVGPMKTEVSPGDGDQVQVGEEIHYRVYWQNYRSEEAAVTVEDPLDPGVDFVRAEYDGVTLNAVGSGADCHTDKTVTLPPSGAGVSQNVPVIQYFNGESGDHTPNHCVVWNLGVQPALADGYVDLYVRVNENAHDYWQYGREDEPVVTEPGGAGAADGKDHEVVNRAGVTVGNDHKIYTDVMENPVPEKTETQIEQAGGDETAVSPEEGNLTPKPGSEDTVVGPLVKIGDVITYEISWKNGYDKAADVIVTDVLDMGRDPCGVDFESAGFRDISPIELTAEDVKDGKYSESDDEAGIFVSYNDRGQPVVTWNLQDRPAGAEGTVILKVKVNQHALLTGYVDNRAQVTVGNSSKYTGIVENPTPEIEKTEPSPGPGMQVMPGDKVDYEIKWNNYHEEAAAVVVRDMLDPGVNFSSAAFSGDEGEVVITWDGGLAEAPAAGKYPAQKPTGEIKNTGTVKLDGRDVSVTITYNPDTHTISWAIGTGSGEKVPAGYAGRVKFSVIVNDRADEEHEYGADGNIGQGITGDIDDRILNQGGVTVDNDSEILTNIIPNPTKPEKDEAEINDRKVTVTGGNVKVGPEVQVGDVITYTITWQNDAVGEDGSGRAADVTVMDVFKTPGLEFVTAGFVSVDENGNESYPDGIPSGWSVTIGKDGTGNPTVSWKMPNQAFGSGGKVWVKARITKDALNEVVNGATIYVGDASRQVEDVTNPVSDNGGLRVTKTVTGTGDKSREWHFTVTLTGRADDGTLPGEVNGQYGDMMFCNGVAEFTLKHGESMTSFGLPAGLRYTVIEEEADKDDYTTTVVGDSGTIPKKDVAEAEFINGRTDNPPPPSRSYGTLTVSKTVTGRLGDTDRQWHFRVELSEALAGQYGDMYFKGGVAEFTLKHGQSATALNLPAGITYKVTESEANKGGYTTSTSAATGTITNGGTAKAEFVNNKTATTLPKTGDDSNLGFWLAMMMISIAGVIMTAVALFWKRWQFTADYGKRIKK